MAEPGGVTMDSEIAPKSNSRKNREHHELAAWGNYHNYYFHRAPVTPDARLSLLPPDLFTNRRVLDLGCNAGKLTLESVSHLAAGRALGIDLDEHLIGQAKELAKVQGVEDRVDFVVGDFMQDPDSYFSALRSSESRPYDTVLLLSITKWLHLHNGDNGLDRLFYSLFTYLAPGGHLIVEPQEWDNYKSAVRKNKMLREAFKGLTMRPPFEDELKVCGFELRENIERDEGGFSRPLLIWRKP